MKLLDECVSWGVSIFASRRGFTFAGKPLFLGRPILTARTGSRIQIGRGFVAVSRARDQVIGINHRTIIRAIDRASELSIGDDCGVSGATIVCKNSIRIGDGTMLGSNVLIMDTDFHPIHHSARRYAAIPERRERDGIVIGNNVFIGAGSTILKGTRIGDNSVIGAGSVVRGEWPSNSICAGNPAVLIGQVSEQAPPGSGAG